MENDKKNINHNKFNHFKFRKFPGFVYWFHIGNINESKMINDNLFTSKYFLLNNRFLPYTKENDMRNQLNQSQSNNNIKIFQIVNRMKIGFFRLGNLMGSLWFGVFLFAMQSYLLRQNLGLTNNTFSSS